MSIVNLGRFDRWITKLFNIKGAPTLSDINPQIQVSAQMQNGVEERFLQSWDRFALAQTVPAQGAGNFSGVRIRNPAGSQTLVVFEMIKIVSTGSLKDTYAVQIARPAGADLGAINLTGNQLDSRGRTGPTVIATFGTAPGIGATFYFGSVPADGTDYAWQYPTQEFVLLPSEGIQVKSGTLNQAFVAIFVWRERALETSELT